MLLGLFAGYILFRSKAKNLRSLVGDAVSPHPHYFMPFIKFISRVLCLSSGGRGKGPERGKERKVSVSL